MYADLALHLGDVGSDGNALLSPPERNVSTLAYKQHSHREVSLASRWPNDKNRETAADLD